VMKKLSSMKHNSSTNVREHIMEMRDVVAELKSLEIDILVHLIMNSLRKEYGLFKVSYYTHKDKWTVNKLPTMCVQEEERLKYEKIEITNLATHDEANDKKPKDNPKGKINQVSKVKKSNVVICFFCKKK
ncbi:hypothetical protein Pfo_001756, partial [Paulownia fortunei]